MEICCVIMQIHTSSWSDIAAMIHMWLTKQQLYLIGY